MTRRTGSSAWSSVFAADDHPILALASPVNLVIPTATSKTAAPISPSNPKTPLPPYKLRRTCRKRRRNVARPTSNLMSITSPLDNRRLRSTVRAAMNLLLPIIMIHRSRVRIQRTMEPAWRLRRIILAPCRLRRRERPSRMRGRRRGFTSRRERWAMSRRWLKAMGGIRRLGSEVNLIADDRWKGRRAHDEHFHLSLIDDHSLSRLCYSLKWTASVIYTLYKSLLHASPSVPTLLQRKG